MPNEQAAFNRFFKKGQLITDYCQILGITPGFDEKELRKAYTKIALQYHPDKNNDKISNDVFKIIQNAYDELKDPVRRKIYLTSLEARANAESEELLKAKIAGFIRRHSLNTKDADILRTNPEFATLISDEHDKNPQSVNLIKSLLFINKHLTGLKDTSFLKSHPETTKIIAKAYDKPLNEQSLNQIKCLIFLNKHLPSLKDVYSFQKKFNISTESIVSAYEQELSRSNVSETIQQIKALNFINRNLPGLKDVTFLKTNPDIEKIIAQADDDQLSHPKDSINKALNLIKSLSFIKTNVPNIKIEDISFLKENDDTAKVVARAYDKKDPKSHAINLIQSLVLIDAHRPKLADVSFLNDYPEAAKKIAEAPKDLAIKLIKSFSFAKSQRVDLKQDINFPIQNASKFADAYDKQSSGYQRDTNIVDQAIELIIKANAANTSFKTKLGSLRERSDPTSPSPRGK